MLQCENSWTWWELLMKFFHDCDIAVTRIGCCESKLTPKWFSFCERMSVEAQTCSNLLIFMLQQSTTRMSQLKTVARFGRRRKSATLWGMMKGWKSITLTLQIQNHCCVLCGRIIWKRCNLLSSIVRDEAALLVHSAPSQLRLALHGNTVCLVQWKSVAYVTL